MVDTTLRFLIEQVGQVDGAYPAEGQLAENFLIKRTVGDGIDFAGLVAFHASPVWILAALADISGAGRHIIDEIVTSLKEEGLLDRASKFEGVDQILDGLEQTSGQLASSLRFPPLDIQGLRKEWGALKDAAAKIPPRKFPSPDLLFHRWEELKQEAAAQNRSTFELSTLIAFSTIRTMPTNLWRFSRSAGAATFRTGHYFAKGLLDHYKSTLRDIHKTGYLAWWTREFHPYLRAAAKQFSAQHESLTERLLNRGKRA